jgi:hypothetical protein
LLDLNIFSMFPVSSSTTVLNLTNSANTLAVVVRK